MKKSVNVDGTVVEAEVTCNKLWLKVGEKVYERAIKPNYMLMDRRTKPTWQLLTLLEDIDKSLLGKIIHALTRQNDISNIGKTHWVIRKQ